MIARPDEEIHDPYSNTNRSGLPLFHLHNKQQHSPTHHVFAYGLCPRFQKIHRWPEITNRQHLFPFLALQYRNSSQSRILIYKQPLLSPESLQRCSCE